MNKQTVSFASIVAVLLAAGYLGYRYGFLDFIYNVMIPGAFSQYNLIVLSIVFGIAAFFSPCAFTVLPAYVANLLGQKRVGRGRVLYTGIAAASGIIAVNMVLGFIIALLGAATPFAKDPRQDIPVILGIRTLAGALIALLGVSMLLKRSPNLHFVQKFFSGSPRNLFTFGVFYNAAAIGCTGPILLGLMLYAYASGSFVSALTAFAVFSLTMGMLMVVVTLFTGTLRIRWQRAAKLTPTVQTVAAVIMVFVGLSIVLLTLEGNNIFVQIFFPYLG